MMFGTSDGQVFGLNFGHKNSVDASIFGMRQQAYDGCSSYNSEKPVSLASNTPVCAPHDFRLRHSISLTDDGTRIVFEANRWRIRLTKGRLPVGIVLPIREGDLVAHGSSTLLHVAKGYPKLEISGETDNTFVMVLAFDELSEADANIDMTVAPDATISIDTWAQVSGAARAMKDQMIGIDNGRLVDTTRRQSGALTRGACLPGPVVTCPYQYNLDHPPYVLLQASGDGIRSTCQRAVQKNNTSIHIFAKVLFAPYRVERQNPAEVMVPGGRKIGQVEISILNPDGTPYHTHGVPFSMSLATVTLHP
jgi:hypothetical protein